MTIREAVTLRLKRVGFKPYLETEYNILSRYESPDKPQGLSMTAIAQDVYRMVIPNYEITGIALMKLISAEIKGRGYYVEGEPHNVP